MLEFETFAYLDVQKTGSTFISSFLRKYCGEELIVSKKHRLKNQNRVSKKFSFISVRDPLDQYISLYSYGCEKNGRLFRVLTENGFGHFYDTSWEGFSAWLAFVLDPGNVEKFDERYAEEGFAELNKLLGYQSYRVIKLAVPHAEEVLSKCTTREAISEAYEKNKIIGYTVRYESLRSDLAELVRTRLKDSMRDLPAALEYIEDSRARNTSTRVDKGETKNELSPELKLRLRDREWFMYEHFGYSLETGAPPHDRSAAQPGVPQSPAA